MQRLFLTVVAALALGGCIVEAPANGPGGASTPQAPSATAIPRGQPVAVRVGANLEDKLILLGAQLYPAQLSPSQPMKVRLVFQVAKPVGDDEGIFVHLEDAETGVQIANLDHPPTSGPTSQWPAQRIVADDFQITLPPNYSGRAVNLYVGLWNPRTNERMAVKNTTEVRTDQHNRILIGPIPVAS